jgi:hypothetical protein
VLAADAKTASLSPLSVSAGRTSTPRGNADAAGSRYDIEEAIALGRQRHAGAIDDLPAQ